MTILLYDYCELEERVSKNLKIWKAFHISLYAIAAVFGILNYSFLQGTIQFYGDKCILYPRKLMFREIDVPCFNQTVHEVNEIAQNVDHAQENAHFNETGVATDKNSTNVDEKSSVETVRKVREKREDEIDFDIHNVTVINGCTGNATTWQRPILDIGRSLFGSDNDCQWALYTPLVSTIFAAVWITLFTMCAGGGRVRTGLQQPWRILAPAVVFAGVFVIVTGHSFSRTTGGLHAFCDAFSNYTNTSTCSPVSDYTQAAWNASMGVGARIAITRACSAAVWASWACAAALLLARCLAAPDFAVKKTGILLQKDPQQKVSASFKPSPKKQNVQFTIRPKSPKDDTSVHSEPTATSELVTASVEHHDESVPSSIFNTPIRRPDVQGPMLEMTSYPQTSKGEQV